jgi:alkylation response protein AidB-like acyl-CoA dehydrogenase
MTSIASGSTTDIRAWWRGQAVNGEQADTTYQPTSAAALMRSLAGGPLLDLPLPGGGQTRRRFGALIALGESDLTVGRLAEAHLDAIAILAELGSALAQRPSDSVWAVWAAEPPTARVSATTVLGDGWLLNGRKAWCSGAGGSSHALVTAHADDGPRLFAVDLDQVGVRAMDDPWPAAALSGTDTRTVEFSNAVATAVGGPGDYVNRTGFWHGAVGVAAVWFGGAVGVARTLLGAGQRRPLSEIDTVHLGAVGAALAGGRAALNLAAESFDDDPTDTAGRVAITARSTRAVVEAAAAEVIDRVGRALGAAPLALDGDHSRRVADLTLYVRQSHADRDLADLGKRMVEEGALW